MNREQPQDHDELWPLRLGLLGNATICLKGHKNGQSWSIGVFSQEQY